jgi:phosphoserine aminotransferase
MTKRIYNFGAGPAVLPEPVLEEARENLLSLGNLGIGILEVSHRSKHFEEIINTAEANVRKLLSVPDDYSVMFLQGGASLQFSMVPMNLLARGETADYIVSGSWSQKAVAEAQKVGFVNVAASTEKLNFKRLPKPEEIKLTPGGAYVHFTSNNTIFGTQWPTEPYAGKAPLVCDASSDIMWRPIDVSKYGLIYAGAQKNLGPAGVTLVIIRNDLLERSDKEKLPTMMNYALMAKEKSLYNTPPAFAVYIVMLVTKWLLNNGGLKAMEEQNRAKAGQLYKVIDRSQFYKGHSEPDCRSHMNVTFTLPDKESEAAFLQEASAQGMSGLKGHRSVGGCRASLYNAFPPRGVEALCEFMKKFELKQKTGGGPVVVG